MIRIIGYGRESTREQAVDGFNLDEQERKIREYVDVYYEGQDIQFTMFREEGASARSLKRPKMKMILDEIQGGAVDVLIVHNLDRLTRKLVDMEWLIELFEKKNVELISLKEHVDTSTPQGRFFVSIMILIAQWEEDTIADRTKRGMQESARQGNYAKPKVPLGYYRDPENTRKLLIDKEQAEVVKYIFRSIAENNMTPFTVAKRLRTNHVLKRRWTDATVLAIVRNKAYYGTFEWHGEMYADHTPAIIEKSLWDKANSLAQNREFRKFTYQFKGMIHCKDCGTICGVACTTKKNGTTYLYYTCPSCRKYVNEDKIRHSIRKPLDEMVVNHNIYTQLNTLHNRYIAADKQIKSMIYYHEFHGLDKSYMDEMVALYTERKDEAEAEINRLKPDIEKMIYSSLPEEEFNQLVQMYIDQIVVNFSGHLVEIAFNDEYRRIMKHVF